jgi:hypothetical protein
MPRGGRKPYPRPSITGATNRVWYPSRSFNATFILLVPLILAGASTELSFGQAEQSTQTGMSAPRQINPSPATPAQSNAQVSVGGGESQSSSAALKDRLQLRGTQAADAPQDTQPLQCKPSEEKKEAWRPGNSATPSGWSPAENPAATKSSFDHVTPQSNGQVTLTPSVPPNPPAASSPQTVVYSDGKLAIKAHDATLGEILSSIRAQNGTAIECPPGIAEDRVFVDIGLMPMREALVALLDGSGFNYILKLGTNPQLVKQIILTARGGQPEMAVASANSPQQPGVAEVYGGQGYTTDPADDTPQIEATAPNTIPTIPASLGLSVTDEDLKKPPAQLLDELQKRQNRLLDAQVEQASQSNPQ